MCTQPLAQQYIGKFKEHLSQVDESVLVILKGHLIIEELLDEILSRGVFHAQFVETASLRFAQKINLARSLSLREQDNEMWNVIVAVNALRNEMAHSLGSEKRKKKTQALLSLCIAYSKDSGLFENNKEQPEHVLLFWGCAFAFGFLTGLNEELKRFRSIVSTLDAVMNKGNL